MKAIARDMLALDAVLDLIDGVALAPDDLPEIRARIALLAERNAVAGGTDPEHARQIYRRPRGRGRLLRASLTSRVDRRGDVHLDAAYTYEQESP